MELQRAAEIARFNELDEAWVHDGGVSTRCIFVGPRNNSNGPVGMAIKVDKDVGDRIAGRHSFSTTTMMVVLTGEVMHDGRWMTKGDIYVCPPGQMSGDLLFGSEGGVIFIMFEKRSGIIPQFEDPADQARFDQFCRSDAELVASGSVEKSVTILPPRDNYTRNRAITYYTVADVAAYREKSGVNDW